MVNLSASFLAFLAFGCLATLVILTTALGCNERKRNADD